MISAVDNYHRHFVTILGSRMAYVDEGPRDAPIVVLLHGNPTSSYLWRNIIPYVAPTHRCIAPDLIGMGDSAKPDIAYRYTDHARYLAAFFAEVLPVAAKITLVIHDWGSALGFDWAMQHPARVRGIAFMEPILMPMTWESMPERARAAFQGMRTPGVGERMVLDENLFIEANLPNAIMRKLTEEELDRYRAPFRDRASRKPMLAWPRELPIAGEPPEMIALVDRYRGELARSPIPKLAFAAEPGSILRAPLVEWCRANLPNLEVVPVGPGLHYVQEDNPDAIGAALARWIPGLPA